MAQCSMQKVINDVFTFYEANVAPAYAYLVAITGEKPIQVLVEIENAFAHLSQSVKGENVQANIDKAYNHLVRLYIDLYKLLLVEVKKISEKRNIILDLSFIKLTKEAREYEINHVGNADSIPIVGSKYAKAINVALSGLGLDQINS